MWFWLSLIVIAVGCLGNALIFLGLVGPSIAGLLFGGDYWHWTLPLFGSGTVLLLLCAPFNALMCLLDDVLSYGPSDYDSLFGGGRRSR